MNKSEFYRTGISGACPAFWNRRSFLIISDEKYVNKSKKSVDRSDKTWYYKQAVDERWKDSEKSLKKFLTERYRCDNLVWLSQKSRDAERHRKKLFEKVLDKQKTIW